MTLSKRLLAAGERLAELEERLAQLKAAQQALQLAPTATRHGYLSVNTGLTTARVHNFITTDELLPLLAARIDEVQDEIQSIYRAAGQQ